MGVLAYLSLAGVMLSVAACTSSVSEDSWMTVEPLSGEEETLAYKQQGNQDDTTGEAGLSITWKTPEDDVQTFSSTLHVSADLQMGRKRGREECEEEVLHVGYTNASSPCQEELKYEREECELHTETLIPLNESCEELVEKTCTEKSDCSEFAGTDCCWIPGHPSSKKWCVEEVDSYSTLSYDKETVKREDIPSRIQNLFSNGLLQVMVLPVGQGDCIAMNCPNGDLVMFDCGYSSQQRSKGRTRALNATEVKNIVSTFDKVNILISHPDKDHYNHLQTIFSESDGEPRNNIERIIIGGHPKSYSARFQTWMRKIASDKHSKLCAIAEYKSCIGNCSVHTIFFNEGWKIGNKMNLTGMCGTSQTPVEFDIIAANVGSTKNEESIVLKVTAGSRSRSRSVLFTGDMEGDAATTIATTENEKLNMPSRLQSDVFQISHHGASANKEDGTPTCNTLEWLQAIRPKEAFVSHAFKSQYGHPHCDTIQRLLRIRSIATDACSEIDLQTNTCPPFETKTHPYYCAKGRGGDLSIGDTPHHIFSTHPRGNLLCVILFTLGENPASTTYTCYEA